MNTWIGTSGFQYTEWKGNFYPEDMPTSKMLPFYAERFNTTEINYTFHRIPAAKTIENWNKATPERFQFALKAPQKITHWAKLRDCADTMRYFPTVCPRKNMEDNVRIARHGPQRANTKWREYTSR